MKLQLKDISKAYTNGENVVALSDVSLGFQASEFVAVLGPSGSGKTTLLNIIGGLDRYDEGDLVINGISTTQFKDADWDAYRNRSIGFVFQSYNLISHQTVARNVEIALALSGISAAERHRRTLAALDSVGLADQAHKRPNQLSGGQMQRVAIARALVNNPDIILADEPTGALDSKNSEQLMKTLQEISKNRLVIMVTHNRELAERFSTRIIELLDGSVQSDSRHIKELAENLSEIPSLESASAPIGYARTSMSMTAALGLSLQNLLSKRGRAITTAIAGSIGIIGVALVLALSGGLSSTINDMQRGTLSGFPVSISAAEQSYDIGAGSPFADGSFASGNRVDVYEQFPDDNAIHSYDSSENRITHINILDNEYLAYIANLPEVLPGTVSTITYQYGVEMNLLAATGDGIIRFETEGGQGGQMAALLGSSLWQEAPDNAEFILSLYDLIGEGSRLPQSANEIALVMDEYNRLPASFLVRLGLDGATYSIEDFIGLDLLKVIHNDDFYKKSGDLYVGSNPADYQDLFESTSSLTLTVVGVLRIREDAATSYFTEGLIYTSALTDYVLTNAKESEVAKTQAISDTDILTGITFANERARQSRLYSLGADGSPTGISIYPVDFAAKDSIKDYLDAYNSGRDLEAQVVYTDMAEMIASMTGTVINTVSLVLIGFAAISLVVSTIMIAIITYVSVFERTKEIGILRSVGARKKDITRVFIAETLIIGFAAGFIGVALALLLCLPINGIISMIVGISELAALSPVYAGLLILGSMALALVAGLFPARSAARKNPVEALHTE